MTIPADDLHRRLDSLEAILEALRASLLGPKQHWQVTFTRVHVDLVTTPMAEAPNIYTPPGAGPWEPFGVTQGVEEHSRIWWRRRVG